jgi:GT2 family glycosyltransferase
MFPTIRIVIVNWNAGLQLWDCLQSIVAANEEGFIVEQVVVVDNASTDGSASGLGDLDLPLHLICNGKNRGFGAACNQGARGSSADYLLFLNPDVRLFKNSLTRPLGFMEQPENEKVAIAGIQLSDASGRVARTCARFPTPGRFFSKMLGLDRLFPQRFPSHFMREWDHGETRFVDHVIGAFFLVRRSVFESLGSFDERFFVYLEDLDFSYRGHQMGWKSVYLATAQAYHAGGGTSNQIKARRLFYSLRSRILYGYKHFGFFSATLLMLGTILIEPFSRLVLAGMRWSLREAGQTVQAYGLLCCALPAILRDTWQGRVRAKK